MPAASWNSCHLASKNTLVKYYLAADDPVLFCWSPTVSADWLHSNEWEGSISFTRPATDCLNAALLSPPRCLFMLYFYGKSPAGPLARGLCAQSVQFSIHTGSHSDISATQCVYKPDLPQWEQHGGCKHAALPLRSLKETRCRYTPISHNIKYTCSI